MRIGIIGAGRVGSALGSALAGAGHTVVHGVRDPGGRARAAAGTVASVAEAAAHASLLVLATPYAAAGEALRAAGPLGDKVVVDATNPIGPGFQLLVGQESSGAEELAKAAPGVRLVKAFNTTGFENLADPRFGKARALMPVAGDDPAAVQQVAELAQALGFEAVALPGLLRSRQLEPLALLWIKLAHEYGLGRRIAFGLERRGGTARKGEPTPAAAPAFVAIVGSGNIGGALARSFLAAGHRVRLLVRAPDAAGAGALVAAGAELAAIGPGAARGAAAVVVAVPASAAATVAGQLALDDGQVVVDCTNAIAKGFTLEVGHTDSSAERLARALPRARVVRAFHQQGAETLQDPRFGDQRAVSFIAGDDADARARVRGLAADAGLDAVEAGPLATARLLEPITLLWVALGQALGTRQFGLTLLRRFGLP